MWLNRMDWKEFNRKHKIGIKWGLAKRLTKKFMKQRFNEHDFMYQDDRFIDFSDEMYCYDHIFDYFLGD